ncbi:hypothetical protein M5J09_00765 [Corynebacterium sp. BF-R-2]|nr:hypothetical protein [Corynebacterium sp. BF-R-2]
MTCQATATVAPQAPAEPLRKEWTTMMLAALLSALAAFVAFVTYVLSGGNGRAGHHRRLRGGRPRVPGGGLVARPGGQKESPAARPL